MRKNYIYYFFLCISLFLIPNKLIYALDTASEGWYINWLTSKTVSTPGGLSKNVRRGSPSVNLNLFIPTKTDAELNAFCNNHPDNVACCPASVTNGNYSSYTSCDFTCNQNYYINGTSNCSPCAVESYTNANNTSSSCATCQYTAWAKSNPVCQTTSNYIYSRSLIAGNSAACTQYTSLQGSCYYCSQSDGGKCVDTGSPVCDQPACCSYNDWGGCIDNTCCNHWTTPALPWYCNSNHECKVQCSASDYGSWSSATCASDGYWTQTRVKTSSNDCYDLASMRVNKYYGTQSNVSCYLCTRCGDAIYGTTTCTVTCSGGIVSCGTCVGSCPGIPPGGCAN